MAMRSRMYRVLATALTLWISLGSSFSHAQPEKVRAQLKTRGQVMAELAETPAKAGGVYYTPDYLDTPGQSRPPKGYKPFYLSHYGRHGARYYLKDSYWKGVQEFFHEAERASILTPYGKQLTARIDAFMPEVENLQTSLTGKGARQHEAIARRIWKQYPEIWKKNPEVTALASQHSRCLMSMMAFCSQLLRLDPKLDLRQRATYADLAEVNWRSSKAPWHSGKPRPGMYVRKDPWGGDYASFLAGLTDGDALWKRLFTDPAAADRILPRHRALTDLYNFVSDLQCFDTRSDFSDLFAPEEYRALWEAHNYVFYVDEVQDTPADSMTFRNMMKETDRGVREALRTGRPAARLRFGHDNVVLSSLTMMNADGMGIRPACASDIILSWRNYNVPMAATLEWVFYRSKKSPVILFKVLLNGRELALPLEPAEGCYYRWEDFVSAHKIDR